MTSQKALLIHDVCGLCMQVAMRDLDPTAKGYWQRVAKMVPGGRTADECHDYHLAQFGATPAAKPGKLRNPVAAQMPQKGRPGAPLCTVRQS